jgi:hypothetical protein
MSNAVDEQNKICEVLKAIALLACSLQVLVVENASSPGHTFNACQMQSIENTKQDASSCGKHA